MDVAKPDSTGDGNTDSSTDAGDLDCGVHCSTGLALGLEHACALATDGTVRCWGLNDLGQLGVGPAGSDGGVPDFKNTPELVVGIGPVKAITAGFYHTCALLADDSVWCWGDNSRGQLAQPADGGPQPPKIAPQRINPQWNGAMFSGITQLRAGGWHTCALWGGFVSCWGLNSSGQVGIGTGSEAGVSPAFVTTITLQNAVGGNVFDIGLGDQFSCMVRDAGYAGCFGSNSFGQLGRGGDAGEPPYDPKGGGTVFELANNRLAFAKSNGSHQCLKGGQGGPWCWGRNQQGQVNGMNTAPITSPQIVFSLKNVAEFAPGGNHTCARIFDAGVQCWGGNLHGQAGQMIAGDPEAGVSSPTDVPGLTNVIQVASGGGDFSCAIANGGFVWCWGANFHGQLGRGGNAPQFTDVPAKVAF